LRVGVRGPALIAQSRDIGGGQVSIEPRQHDSAARQLAEAGEERRRCRDRASRAGGDYRLVAIDQWRREGLAQQALVAQCRRIGLAAIEQDVRPRGEDDIEEFQRFLPVGSEVLRGDGAEGRGVHPLDSQIVEQA
jgi:hypothetical protein